MDGVTGLLERARAAGLRVSVARDKLVIRGPRSADTLARELLEHKPEVVHRLLLERYELVYGGETAGDAELNDIERQVREHGVCLLWAEVLDDYVGFYLEEADRTKVPVGFVPYSDDELRELFGDDTPDISAEALSQIHSIKKAGPTVRGNRPDVNGTS